MIKKALFVLREILLQDQAPTPLEELPPIQDQAPTALEEGVHHSSTVRPRSSLDGPWINNTTSTRFKDRIRGQIRRRDCNP
ncbi:hypothetical protein ACFX1W_023039 [Malus domestica]